MAVDQIDQPAIVQGHVVALRSRAALTWNDDGALYRCGLIARPADFLWAPLRPFAPWLSRLARRYISSGSGCDSDLVTAQP